MRRTLCPLAALAVLAAIVAGCGSGSAGTGNSSATSGASTATAHQKSEKFAECMRANGVSGFPDPDATGSLTIDAIANGSSVDVNSTAFNQAMSACKNLQPPGFTGGNVTPQQRTARLQFARCVRQNGVPDFPDPTPNGPLVDTNRIPSSNTASGMSNLNAAMQKCSQYAAAAGVKANQ
jgi:hypothetical protein